MPDESVDLWPEKYSGVAVEVVKHTARSKYPNIAAYNITWQAAIRYPDPHTHATDIPRQ